VFIVMYVSRESVKETHSRLRSVIKKSRLKVYGENYYFCETAVGDREFMPNPRALAIVRDDVVWSQLVPVDGKEKEAFKVFRFHFREGEDNSGFVGWLSSILKRELGTGVFVICGQNSKDGGIYDYYGCPLDVATDVEKCISKLRA